MSHMLWVLSILAGRNTNYSYPYMSFQDCSAWYFILVLSGPQVVPSPIYYTPVFSQRLKETPQYISRIPFLCLPLSHFSALFLVVLNPPPLNFCPLNSAKPADCSDCPYLGCTQQMLSSQYAMVTIGFFLMFLFSLESLSCMDFCISSENHCFIICPVFK